MARWIDKIIDATVEAESPERYQYWAAMCALAATMKKNVYLDRFYYKLYPNLYVMIVGKSGLRKGNPVTLSKKLVTEANVTRVVAGRASVQAILKEIGKAQSIEGGGIIKDASAYLVAGEAASFMVADPAALTILTDLYDTHAHEPEWKNILKSSGTDVLKNPCITFLWATNEDHFNEAVGQKDVQGGFIARSLIVLEDKRRTHNDLMDRPKTVPNIKELVLYLKEVNKRTGEFQIHPEAKQMYSEWYKQLSLMPHEDPTGTVERLGDTALKVAMVLSIADDLSLCIKPSQMDEAIRVCVECLGGLKQVTMGTGQSDTAIPTKLIIKELLAQPTHQFSRKKFISKYWGEFDSLILDRVIESLLQAEAVIVHRLNGGKEIVYELVPEAVEAYQRFKQEIN